MRKRYYIFGSLILFGLLAWYWFRPELLLVNARVDETLPLAARDDNAVIARGSFHSVAHDSKGMAAVHQLGDGRRVLRLTEFETSNGPALKVYLIAADDAADSGAVRQAEFIDLGALKGNIGDQNYDLPASVDLSKYRAVTIWCERFSVNFATAPLALQKSVAAASAAR